MALGAAALVIDRPAARVAALLVLVLQLLEGVAWKREAQLEVDL